MLIEANLKLERSLEELKLIKRDMGSYFKFYSDISGSLREKMLSIQELVKEKVKYSYIVYFRRYIS